MPNADLFWTGLISGALVGATLSGMIFVAAFYRAHGLAAPQVGWPIRLVSLNPGTTIGFNFIVNPEIVKHGNNRSISTEGCLSIEHGRKFFSVKRWDTVTVRFQTIAGETKEVLARGLGARAVQHEIDHLNGKLIGGVE